MAYYRKDRWETPAPDIVSIASRTFDNMRERDINQLNYCEHYPVSDNPEDTTIIMVYDGLNFDHEGEKPKDHPPEIYCRVMKYADSKSENKARQIYFIPFESVEDDELNFKIVCERINSVINTLKKNDGPYSVINVSRKCLRYVQPPKRFRPLDILRVINRLENFHYGREVFEGVVSIPDRNVFKRNDFGKIGKENQTVIGEWVYATYAALDGNKYDIDADNYTYEVIRTEKQWTLAFEEILNAEVLAIDTETKNLNRIANQLACIQLTCDGSHAFIIPFDHPDITLPPKLMQRIKDDLTDYFEYEKSKYHIYANAKFDLIQIIRELKLRWYNHDIADVQGAAQMLDENRKFRSNVKLINGEPGEVIPGFALEQLIIERGCSAYLQTSMGKADRANIFSTPFEMVAEYGGLDAVLTWRLLYSQLEEANDRGDDYDRFMLILTGQINSMIRAFVRMELTGLPIDRAYLAREQSKTDGVFEKARQQARQELYMLESVQEANKILLRDQFGTEEDLFGKNDNWIFDIDKTEHQQVLFFEVLGLEPLKVGKNGLPSVDKAFKEYYAPKSDDGKYLETSVEEVELFAQYGELKQLFNSFMKAFYKKLFTSDDMRVDGRLRPSFKYLTIVTGRTGASDPSLQNVPQRSKMAKPVKRQFITKPGSIYVKADFSSHETRNWGIASGEDRLAESYIKGLTERNKFRIKDVTTPEEWEEFSKHMKQFDLHVINCGLFYGLKPEEVTKPIRSKVKTTAFGVLYGMAAPRLAQTLKISEEEAQQLIDTLFEKFPDGSAYITITHKHAQTYLVCVSGIGRVRHMWGYLHTDRGVQGGMDRRGPNSMIQGISSEEGMEANYQLQWHIWHLFHKQDLPLEIEICNTVHDSTENISPIVHAPIAAYLIEHCGTTHIHRRFRKRYGMEFNVGLEMEFEFGPSLGEMNDWNYRPEQLEQIVMKSQEWAHKTLGHPMQTEKQMKAFRHNNNLLFKLRQEELMEMPRNGVGELMILDKHIARELAF